MTGGGRRALARALALLLALPALAATAAACKGAKPVKKPEPALLAAQTEAWTKVLHGDGKVIKPKNMYKYGRVVYDSGPRDREAWELPDD